MVTSVEAVSFPIAGRSRSSLSSLLGKRSVDIGAFGNGSTKVYNHGDMSYYTNITLGGTEFSVEIDTGSSDLWVSGDVPNTKNLSIEAEVDYVDSSAKGFINTADMVFGDFTIKDQAYINAIPPPDTPENGGLIGLGPAVSSEILAKINGTAGAPPLDRIFLQNASTPNFLSVLLSRQTDGKSGSTASQTGQLTIGSVIPKLEDITKQKKLSALRDEFGIQHWQTLLDEDGIIGPDGENLLTKTSIPDPKQGTTNQLHVMFDTGYSFPPVSREISDAIYGRVPGAVFVTQDGSESPGYWRVPCDYELNVTFSFGGVKYPIAPLDLTMPEQGDSSEKLTTCMSTFQQIPPSVADHTRFGGIDAILGMAFLRNAYLLINFGDFVDGSNTSVADPYIQLLSVTGPAAAHKDFVNARLGGLDKTGSQPALLPESEAKHSPQTKADANTSSLSRSHRKVNNRIKGPYYKSCHFITVSVVGVLLLAAVVFFIFSRFRARRKRACMVQEFKPAMAGVNVYAPMTDPVSRPQSVYYA
ncbi:acid protease [Fomitiporia mediterranea MF3/22]|uniref:acid protease n=1 Tax=Fomitiporia mediterranea (strain MF3/22) TaxID=694068 RepID=UPI00044074E4|nr:acid protease [Fomitiporia mediterranea MF3/22]EJD00455.1 acid protease [Fomitiporia mediterranea MF3/22]